MTKSFRMAYTLLGATLVMVTIMLTVQFSRDTRPQLAEFWKTVRPISFEDARAEISELNKFAISPGAPETYYTQVYTRSRALGLRIERTLWDLQEPIQNNGYNTLLMQTQGAMSVVNRAQQAYREKYGSEALAKAGDAWRASYKEIRPPFGNPLPYMWRWYLITLMLAGAFCLTRAHEKGLPVWLEFLQPSHLALAVVAWPMFAWAYPRHTPAQQMQWALRYATLVLGTLLSGGAGVAKAETAKDSSKRDRKNPWSLQLDLRATDTVGGPSAPEFLGKATLAIPSGSFLESTHVIKKDLWFTSEILGVPIAKPKGFVINAVGGVIATSAGNRSITTGFKIFGGGKYWGMGMPACGVERQWSPQWVTTWAAAAQLFAKPTPSLRVGVEASIRKIPGTKPSWYAGGLVGWSFGKGKPAVEGLMFHNSAGAERVRVRATHALAF